MTKEQEDIVSQMKDLVNKYEEEKKAKQKKQLNKPITMNDLKDLMKEVTKEKPVETIIQTQPQTKPQTQPEMIDKKKVIMQIWRNSKTTSIICLIAIMLPMVTTLIAMISGGYALVIALIGVIYPCFIFIKTINVQTRAKEKYGLKPLFQFPQKNMQQQNKKESGGFV